MIPAAPAQAAEVISSSGPLTNIWVNDQMRCQVQHRDDSSYAFWPNTAANGACGPIVYWNGFPYGGGYWNTRMWASVSSTVAGSGTTASPYRLTSVATIASSPLTVTQVLTYVTGQEFYRNDLTVANSSTTEQTGSVYGYIDCYLEGSDKGYGRESGRSGMCTKTPSPGGRVVAVVPITGGNHWQEGYISSLYSHFPNGGQFEDRCECGSYVDNAAGVSWPMTVPAGGTSTYSYNTVFSPVGVTPLVMDVTADTPTSRIGTTNGYVVSVCNPNELGYELTSVSVTLPESFGYHPAQLVGFLNRPPVQAGQTVTWSGVVPIASLGCRQVHFSVDVGILTGRFTVDATAQATAVDVHPVTVAAPVTVTSYPASEQFDLSAAKTAQTDPVTAGTPMTYTVTVTNNGAATSPAYTIADVLPAVSPLRTEGTDPRCGTVEPTPVGQRVTCTGEPLPSGESSSFTIAVTPDGSLATGSQLVNAATVDTADGLRDAEPTNDTAAVSTTVRHAIDVRMDLTAQPTSIHRGETTTLVVGVHNDGPSIATAATAVATLPAGLTWRPTDKGMPDCTIAGPQLTCRFPALVAGDPQFDMLVASTATNGAAPPARLTITGEITAADDLRADNNHASTAVLLAGTPASLPVVEPGDTAPRTLAVTGNIASGLVSLAAVALTLGVAMLWLARARGGREFRRPRRSHNHRART